jgi:hypothetical protein
MRLDYVHVDVKGGLSRELPAWMFDAIPYGAMDVGSPVVVIAA